ncbi:MAG: PUA domain-containing protein [Candidatus Helarchaeota archaeon]
MKPLKIEAKLHPKLDEIISIPVKGPYTIPKYEKKVVVDKFTAESLMQGADLFAPGVLRASKIRIGDKVTIVTKSRNLIAAGVAQMNAREMLEAKRGLAVKIEDSIYKIFSIRESTLFQKGFIFDQSLPSILVSRILNPRPGERIIDLCAAPGGKATHMAQLMQNQGTILAVDRSRPRLQRLHEHLIRLNISNIKILQGDSRKLPAKYYHWADKVLVDPPCSAIGVRPKLMQMDKRIENLIKYQRQFLNAAINYVKSGGELVYSTCTLTTEENEANIKYLLDNFDCKIIRQPIYLGSPGEQIEGLENHGLLQRFYPDIHDTPGYFIAKLRVRG